MAAALSRPVSHADGGVMRARRMCLGNLRTSGRVNGSNAVVCSVFCVQPDADRDPGGVTARNEFRQPVAGRLGIRHRQAAAGVFGDLFGGLFDN